MDWVRSRIVDCTIEGMPSESVDDVAMTLQSPYSAKVIALMRNGRPPPPGMALQNGVTVLLWLIEQDVGQ